MPTGPGAYKGTSAMAYVVSENKKGNKVHCINYMPFYEGRNLLQLRLEDYIAAKKMELPQNAMSSFTSYIEKCTKGPAAPGGMGAPHPLFSAQPLPAPAGLFPNLSSTVNQNPLSSSMNATPSLFMTTSAQPTTNLFATSTPGQAQPLFASNNLQQNPGLFATPLASQSTNLFSSAPAPVPQGLFSATPSSNLFATASQPGSGGLFSAMAPTVPSGLATFPSTSQQNSFGANMQNSLGLGAAAKKEQPGPGPGSRVHPPFSFANNQNQPFALYYVPLGHSAGDFTAGLQSLNLSLPHPEPLQASLPFAPAPVNHHHSFADVRMPASLLHTFDRRSYQEAKKRARRRLSTATSYAPPASSATVSVVVDQSITVEIRRRNQAPIVLHERPAVDAPLSTLLHALVTRRRALTVEEVRRAHFTAGGKSFELFDSVEEVAQQGGVLVVEVDVMAQSLPHLGKADFRISPTMEELGKMTGEELSRVEHFTATNEHARIAFAAPVDLRNVDLAGVLRLEHKLVEVYPPGSSKPDVGQGLNAPARISYFGFELPVDEAKLREIRAHISRMAAEMNAEVEEVDARTETVTIYVPHF